MPQQIRASITFDLPLDPAEETAALATVAAAWQRFTETVKTTTGIKPWGQELRMRHTRGPRPGKPHLRAIEPGGDAA